MWCLQDIKTLTHNIHWSLLVINDTQSPCLGFIMIKAQFSTVPLWVGWIFNTINVIASKTSPPDTLPPLPNANKLSKMQESKCTYKKVE